MSGGGRHASSRGAPRRPDGDDRRDDEHRNRTRIARSPADRDGVDTTPTSSATSANTLPPTSAPSGMETRIPMIATVHACQSHDAPQQPSVSADGLQDGEIGSPLADGQDEGLHERRECEAEQHDGEEERRGGDSTHGDHRRGRLEHTLDAPGCRRDALDVRVRCPLRPSRPGPGSSTHRAPGSRSLQRSSPRRRPLPEGSR